jgi:hypothetical protein
MTQSETANFEYIARLKFASIVRYTTSHDPEFLLGENYFRNSQQYLEMGDEIDVVCRHEDGSWSKGHLEVVTKTPTELVVELVDEWRISGKAKARKMTKHYIPANATWMIKDQAGQVVAKGLNKAEACEMLGEEPPVDAPAEEKAA